MKKLFTLIMLCVFILCSCSSVISEKSESPTGEIIINPDTGEVVPIHDTLPSSDVNLDEIDGDFEILTVGAYTLHGTLHGSIIVELEKSATVELILDGATILPENFAAIYIKSVGKAVITLPEGSENRISDSGAYKQRDATKVNAAIYSKDDLSIGGKGTLTITSNLTGINSKDKLEITGGTLIIDAGRKGMIGKDNVEIYDGNISIVSEKDGISSTNDQQDKKGNIVIHDGVITVKTYGDAISAARGIEIFAGTLQLETMRNSAGNSTRGIKSGTGVTIENATITMNCFGDCINTDGDFTMKAGSLTLFSEDDAIHADRDLVIEDGVISVSNCDEAFQGQHITILGGEFEIHSEDDGINASDPESLYDDERASTDASITISGGVLHFSSGGDGLDSNGSIIINGGDIKIDGPISSTDTAFDYTTEGLINGGTIFAIGSKDEVELPSEESKQVSFTYGFPREFEMGTKIVIKVNSETVLEHVCERAFSSILYSDPSLNVGDSVIIAIDDNNYNLDIDYIVTNHLK